MKYHYVHHISDTLEEVKNYFAIHKLHNQVTVELLKYVALARLSLVGATQLLCARFLGQYSDEDGSLDRELRKVFAQLRIIIGDSRNTDAHLFMLRCIIRSHGNQELTKIIEKSQFHWLKLQLNDEDNRVQVLAYWVSSKTDNMNKARNFIGKDQQIFEVI